MDLSAFRRQYPYFGNDVMWPNETLELANQQVECFINIASSWYRCDKCRELLESLMTAHLAYINGSPTTPGQNNVGTVSNASVGSVSVGITTFAHKSEFTAWLGKSPWGEQLLAMLSRLAVGPHYIGGSPERRAFRKFGGRY